MYDHYDGAEGPSRGLVPAGFRFIGGAMICGARGVCSFPKATWVAATRLTSISSF